MTGSMIPSMRWGPDGHTVPQDAVLGQPPSSAQTQELMCSACLAMKNAGTGPPTAPRQIAMVGGYSYCIQHAVRAANTGHALGADE